MFWYKLKAYAALKEFLPALQDGGEPDMPNDEATPLNARTDAGQVAAKKRNAMAMAAFTMAFTTASAMMFVRKACNINWPSGLAHVIVKELFKKF